MSMMVSFCAVVFFPRDVFDEILNLIESVSEGFPSYSCVCPIVCSSFPFGFENEKGVFPVLVSDHCLFFDLFSEVPRFW